MQAKIQKVLGIFFFCFLAIALRVFQLGVMQREAKLLQAQKPQQRTVLIPASRGQIYDRFHIPLATNKICYNAAIYYSQIAEVPSISWEKKTKIYPRKEYIKRLAETLGKTLDLDPERVEDFIHSKASLFPHVPFILKSSLTEEEHYRLKMLEKDWPGIHAEIASERLYPLKKVGCNIVGTMGMISPKEYAQLAKELSELRSAANLFDSTSLGKLQELKEKAYTIHDLVGKTGIEASFEKELRGYFGKKVFEVDQKGRCVKEIFCKDPIHGKDVFLSISSELQEFAEKLLIENEKDREERSFRYDPFKKQRKIQKQPWIKGGAILAMDPKTAEILAMASYPRFDPNDFVFRKESSSRETKKEHIHRWLETPFAIGSIWDGLLPLLRETEKGEEKVFLSWDLYLDFVLAQNSPLREFFKTVSTVQKAIEIQEDVEAKIYFISHRLPLPKDLQKRLSKIDLPEEDLLFAADLCRVAVYAPAFTDDLIESIGPMSLSEYRSLSQQFLRKEALLRRKKEKEFHQTTFKTWREEHQKEFLLAKRKEEKETKSYAKPYIDYLDQKEQELFELYWEEHKWAFLKSEKMPESLIRTFRSFQQLKRPLLGSYPRVRGKKCQQTEKDLAFAFYPIGGFGLSRSFAFEASAPLGSVFKLVTAYEGARQNQKLEILDEWGPNAVAYTLNRKPYPRFYKGGRLPRTARPVTGKIDLAGALERTSNSYFAILAGDFFKSPEDLVNAARLLGFGEKTGVDLPNEQSGYIPQDLSSNKTGLYSASIGQHTLLTTPLQTARMLSSFANEGRLQKPQIVKKICGMTPEKHPLTPFASNSYIAKEELQRIGIYFPLFTALDLHSVSSQEESISSEVQRIIPFTPEIKKPLFEGMYRVINGEKGSARPSAIRLLLNHPTYQKNFLALKKQMIGKSGTAEIVQNLSSHPSSPSEIYKHIWFACISFTDEAKTDPELVVVVFLRYGDWGKEAAPLAAQVIRKWREIKNLSH